MILEPWYAAHFRTHTLGDRLPNSSGVLSSLGYNHIMASILGWRVRILLLAEFQKGSAMDFSSLSEQALRTSRLYLRAGSSLMIRTDHVERSILRSLSTVYGTGDLLPTLRSRICLSIKSVVSVGTTRPHRFLVVFDAALLAAGATRFPRT